MICADSTRWWVTAGDLDRSLDGRMTIMRLVQSQPERFGAKSARRAVFDRGRGDGRALADPALSGRTFARLPNPCWPL